MNMPFSSIRERARNVITHEKTLVDRFQKRVISLSQGEIADDRVGGMFNA